jgi:hypothetical protein
MVMTPVERQQRSREGRRSDVARIAQRLDAVEDRLDRLLAAQAEITDKLDRLLLEQKPEPEPFQPLLPPRKPIARETPLTRSVTWIESVDRIGPMREWVLHLSDGRRITAEQREELQAAGEDIRHRDREEIR